MDEEITYHEAVEAKEILLKYLKNKYANQYEEFEYEQRHGLSRALMFLLNEDEAI